MSVNSSPARKVEARRKNFSRRPSRFAALFRLDALTAKITSLLFGGAVSISMLWLLAISTRGRFGIVCDGAFEEDILLTDLVVGDNLKELVTEKAP